MFQIRWQIQSLTGPRHLKEINFIYLDSDIKIVDSIEFIVAFGYLRRYMRYLCGRRIAKLVVRMRLSDGQSQCIRAVGDTKGTKARNAF